MQTGGRVGGIRGVSWWLSTLGSTTALVVSGASLWETALKQAQLKVYVGEAISYTRDPWGSYEVLVVPVTIANSGAQEGAVMSMRLDLANAESSQTDTFTSAYTADATWFGGSDNVTNRTRRPKSPFTPLSIPGRGTWSGTILFYSADYREKKIAEPKSKLTATMTLTAPAPEGWTHWFTKPIAPTHMTLEIPNFLPGALLSGDVVRVKTALTP